MLGIQKNEFEHNTASQLYAAVDVCDDSNTPLLLMMNQGWLNRNHLNSYFLDNDKFSSLLYTFDTDLKRWYYNDIEMQTVDEYKLNCLYCGVGY